MIRRWIAFTSDFGLEDHYVGVVKAIIAKLGDGKISVIDISHMVGRHNIFRGAYVSAVAAKYTPKDCVHLVVVDPSVGTGRRIVIYETDSGSVFVAPDNGVLNYAYEWFKGTAYLAEHNVIHTDATSATFHGRDVFAPLAVKLADGSDPSEFGERSATSDLVKLHVAKPELTERECVCSVLNVDVFGNVITNVPNGLLERDSYWLRSTKGRFPVQRKETYAQGAPGSLLLIRGSEGFYEIALNSSSAGNLTGLEPGQKMVLEFG
ncbi:MAG: SAM-dependent chlorinase/fluorinase [Thermoprotei archaeon]